MFGRPRIGFILTLAVVVVLGMVAAYLAIDRTVDSNRMTSLSQVEEPSTVELIDGPPADVEPSPFPNSNDGSSVGDKDLVPVDENGEPCTYVDVDETGTPVCADPADVVVPQCDENQVFDADNGCVQMQLPEEVIGRVIDGPNGEACTVIDAEGNVTCELPEEQPSGAPVSAVPSVIPPSTCD